MGSDDPGRLSNAAMGNHLTIYSRLQSSVAKRDPLPAGTPARHPPHDGHRPQQQIFLVSSDRSAGSLWSLSGDANHCYVAPMRQACQILLSALGKRDPRPAGTPARHLLHDGRRLQRCIFLFSWDPSAYDVLPPAGHANQCYGAPQRRSCQLFLDSDIPNGRKLLVLLTSRL